jgi:hypothetical protein
MKNKTTPFAYKRVFIFGLTLFLAQVCTSISIAHEVVVHQQITLHAASLLAQMSTGYNALLNTITFQNPYGLLPIGGDYRPPIGWMTEGSMREDDQNQDAGGKRSLNHFYNPLNGRGLSDIPPIRGDGEDLYGRPSFIWAALFNEPGLNVTFPTKNINTWNEWSWQNVRQYELQGLTNSDPSIRSDNLARMFRGLGDVVHLLQDTSQPQHVRNEQHLDILFGLPYSSAIEKYGAKHWRELNYSASMLDWQTAGFTKMQDFWDRGLYRVNGVQALKDDASGVPGKQLGLAEFSNGNFIGKTTTYPEYFETSDKDYSKHYFPYPSLISGTDFPRVKSSLGPNVRTVFLKNAVLAHRIYLDKTGDGITFPNHSVLSYMGAYARKTGQILETASTIDDDNVLQEYHNILIPKAVQYSAGLLDYFFRGTLSVSLGYGTNSNQYTITNLNTSGQDFSGGTFYLFEDDTNSIRTLVAQTNLTGTLPNGGSLNMTFQSPLSSGDKHLVVYQGTIGLTGGNASDPVDNGIAIAVAQLEECQLSSDPAHLQWTQVVLGDTGNRSWSLSASGLNGSYNFASQGDGQAAVVLHTELCNNTDNDITLQIDFTGIFDVYSALDSDNIHNSAAGTIFFTDENDVVILDEWDLPWWGDGYEVWNGGGSCCGFTPSEGHGCCVDPETHGIQITIPSHSHKRFGFQFNASSNNSAGASFSGSFVGSIVP